MQQLHPTVALAFEEELIGKHAATEMAAAKPERQAVMLKEMKRVNDFTPAFIRALVLKTPIELRNPDRSPRQRCSPARGEEKEKRFALVERLEKAEKQHDFYTNLYRQYSADLLKMALYVRKVITTPAIRAHLEQHRPATLGELNAIVMET